LKEPDVYDMPDEIDVQADGPLRIITLNRPESLNAVDDLSARAAVITGAGRAFSAGGDFKYLEELANDADLRARTIADGREIVLGMARCRVPVVAAVNGPAVGLGCSLVALSDIVYIAEDAYLADPHVQVGLVAADGGPLTWPLHISLLLAKEYALTGARIPAARAVELGLANHAVADPLEAAIKAAKKILELPQQAVESTKRVLNVHLERAVLATIDYALSAENQSMQTEDFRAIVAKFNAGKN
jgi:enoyl-CoA hydratase